MERIETGESVLDEVVREVQLLMEKEYGIGEVYVDQLVQEDNRRGLVINTSPKVRKAQFFDGSYEVVIGVKFEMIVENGEDGRSMLEGIKNHLEDEEVIDQINGKLEKTGTRVYSIQETSQIRSIGSLKNKNIVYSMVTDIEYMGK